MLTQNIRKLKLIESFTNYTNIDVILLNETHLTKDVYDAEIEKHIPHYSIYRSDRTTREKGCAAILIKKDIPVITIKKYDNDVIEYILIEVEQKDNLKSIYVSFYRPPDTTKE